MSTFFRDQVQTYKDLLDDEELINLTILTEDGGSFKVHLEIMALQSSYFRKINAALLLGKSLPNPAREIVVPSISQETLKSIINYMYTFKLLLSKDEVGDIVSKVRDIVIAAKLLDVPGVITLCENHLTSRILAENCLDMYNFANECGIDDLKENANTFILENFETIYSTSPQFPSFTCDYLMSTLSSDSLNVRSEETVYMAIMKWIESDISNRSNCFPDLLRCLRVGLCDPKFFEENICKNSLMRDDEECQQFISEVNEVFADLQLRNSTDDESNKLEIFDINHPLLRPRIPNEIIFVVGGWSSGSPTNKIETFDKNTKRWFLQTPDTAPRTCHGMLWHQGHIYVIGGHDGEKCSNSVRRYNPLSHVWEERSPMYVKRCYVSVAAVGDFIYAIGGYDGRRRTNSCERYDPSQNQWTMIGSMSCNRSDASADTLDGKIYIAGGYDGCHVLKTVECYDPATNIWTAFQNMNFSRSGAKMVAFQGHLYVIGGFDGQKRLSTVERFDRDTNTWTFVASMLEPRSNFAAAVLDDNVYAIGGFNGETTVSNTEVYDLITNTWKKSTDMNIDRSALAACKVSGIPTAQGYCYLGAYSKAS